MTVYLDVIWLLNFLFDSLLLLLTAVMLKRHVIWWRLCLGGFVGSIVILLSFSPLGHVAGNPLIKLGFSVLMVLTAFGYKRIRFFLKALSFLYISTFLSGGTLIGVHYFVQFDSQMTTDILVASVKGFGDPISWIFIMLGFPIAWYFSMKSVEKLEMTKIQYDQLVDIDCTVQDLRFSVKGLIDSGNHLYDPISKSPVMIVSIRLIEDILPKEIIHMITEPEPFIFGEKEIPLEWMDKVKIIPCRVVGQDHQLLIAFKPDTLVITTDKEIIPVKKSLISFTNQQLSTDDTFQCIVHPKMLTSANSENSQKVS